MSKGFRPLHDRVLVRRVEADRIVLAHGEVETGPDVLHVDCTAVGLRNAPATPMFQPGRIVLQQVRQPQLPLVLQHRAGVHHQPVPGRECQRVERRDRSEATPALDRSIGAAPASPTPTLDRTLASKATHLVVCVQACEHAGWRVRIPA